jgi:hypothetical protein
LRRHPQLGVHACDGGIKLGQQFVGLVQGAVLENVHLDAGEQPERGEPGADPPDDAELAAQPFRGQPRGSR